MGSQETGSTSQISAVDKDTEGCLTQVKEPELYNILNNILHQQYSLHSGHHGIYIKKYKMTLRMFFKKKLLCMIRSISSQEPLYIVLVRLQSQWAIHPCINLSALI